MILDCPKIPQIKQNSVHKIKNNFAKLQNVDKLVASQCQ